MLLVACTVAALAATPSAMADVRADNFNDNVRADFWKTFRTSTTKVKETGKKLKFKSPSDLAGKRIAGYESKGWTLRGDKTYTIEFDYCLEVEGMADTDSAAVGVKLLVTDVDNTLEVMVIQTSEGHTILFEIFDQGLSIERIEKNIPNSRGMVRIEYTQSNDRMKVFVDGESKITFNDLTSGSDPFDLDVQVLGWSFGIVFGFADAWIDNFELNGTID